MQVANAGGSSVLSGFSVSITKQKITIQQQQDDLAPSAAGMRVLAFIAGNTHLSPSDKRTLTRLVAMIDEYAAGDPKLMRAVAGIASMMARMSHKTYPPTTLQKILQMYREERENLRLNKQPAEAARITIETQMLTLRVQLTQTGNAAVGDSGNTASGNGQQSADTTA